MTDTHSPSKNSPSQPPDKRRARPGWLAPVAYLAFGALAVLGLIWIIRNALPGGLASAGLPADSNQQPSETPLPIPTLTPPGEQFTPTVDPAGVGTATPLPFLPPGYLTLESSPGEIAQFVAYPSWNTLWLQGSIYTPQQDGRQEQVVVQAWLGRDGRGLLLTSAPIPRDKIFTSGDRPVHAWVTAHGQSIYEYSFDGAPLSPSQLPSRWSNHPLERAHPLMEMIFPAGALPPGESLIPLEQGSAAFRPALIADWGDRRYWIDAETGLVLRRQPQTANVLTQPLLVLDSVVINPELPAGLFEPENPDLWMFVTQPELLPRPDLPLTPTPTPYPPGDPPQIALSLQEDLPGSDPGDELYMILGSSLLPYTRQFVRVAAGCLVTEAVCPAYWLPPLESGPQATLSWSPDGRQAVLIDFSTGALKAFDPATGQWRTLLEDFPAGKEPIYWSPDQSWIAFSQQSTGDGGFLAALVRPDGSELHPISPELGGQQDVMGWLGNDRLLILHSQAPPKGQSGPVSPPSVYILDIFSGQATRLPFEESWLLAKSYPAPSPDGTRIALSQPGETGNQLVIAGTDGQILQRFDLDGGSPQWSPDGQWLSFIVPGGKGTITYVTRPDGSDMRPIFEASLYPPVLWSPVLWSVNSQFLILEDLVQATPGAPAVRQIYLVDILAGSTRTFGVLPAEGSFDITNLSYRRTGN